MPRGACMAACACLEGQAEGHGEQAEAQALRHSQELGPEEREVVGLGQGGRLRRLHQHPAGQQAGCHDGSAAGQVPAPGQPGQQAGQGQRRVQGRGDGGGAEGRPLAQPGGQAEGVDRGQRDAAGAVALCPPARTAQAEGCLHICSVLLRASGRLLPLSRARPAGGGLRRDSHIPCTAGGPSLTPAGALCP